MRRTSENDDNNLNRLPRSFYARSTPTVAQDLLGKWLIRMIGGQRIGGRIIETEAYLAKDDPASHSSRGKTASNASMFGPAGLMYVYPIHAKFCLNAVTESQGEGCAVLIRAIEPIWGIDTMQRHRGHDELKRLTSGPAMICQALSVDRRFDGIDLTKDSRIAIYDAAELDGSTIQATPRIGISKAKDRLLRFTTKPKAE